MRSILQLGGIAASNPTLAPDTERKHPEGHIVTFDDAYWGGGEAIYVQFNGTVNPFDIVKFVPVFNSTLKRWEYKTVQLDANAANKAQSVGVYMGYVAAASGNWGWIQLTGLTPVRSAANVTAAAPFYTGASAGQGYATQGNGKQILNAVCALAASGTSVVSAYTTNGSKEVLVPPGAADGWFPGIVISGTNITGTVKVVNVSPDGRKVYLDTAATGSGQTSLTGTYNDGTAYFNIAQINRPFQQGQAA